MCCYYDQAMGCNATNKNLQGVSWVVIRSQNNVHSRRDDTWLLPTVLSESYVDCSWSCSSLTSRPESGENFVPPRESSRQKVGGATQPRCSKTPCTFMAVTRIWRDPRQSYGLSISVSVDISSWSLPLSLKRPLWSLLGSETWHLVSQGGPDCPPARHRHSAVLHDNAMWVFGGMTDLQERSDFWRFDLSKWFLLENGWWKI